MANCRRCYLPKLTDVPIDASETSLLFASLHCVCDTEKSRQRQQALADSSTPDQSQGICKRCNKKVETTSRSGSLTGFIFAPLKSMRCQCPPLATRQRPQKTLLKSRQAGRTGFLIANDDLRSRLTIEPGDVIGGAYQIVETIGEGGMGLVFKARHNVLQRTCALKFLQPSVVSEASWRMFKTEAKILNKLSHPGMCTIYDFGIHQDALPYIAMEYLEGVTLERLLENGPLTPGAALEIFTSAAAALAYAHRHQIVHKDIKPANIMLIPQKGGRVDIKILDFGIAQEKQAHDDLVVGSAFYMSPEQFAGEPLGPSADIYSLGCTMYEALNGVPPFDAESFSDLAEMHETAAPPPIVHWDGDFANADAMWFLRRLSGVVAHCLQKSPARRYQSMSELSIDLERLHEGKDLQFAQETDPDSDLDSNEQARVAPTNPAMRPAMILALSVILPLVCIGAFALCFLSPQGPGSKPKIGSSAAEKQVADGAASGGASVHEPGSLTNDLAPTLMDSAAPVMTAERFLHADEPFGFPRMDTKSGQVEWLVGCPADQALGTFTAGEKDLEARGALVLSGDKPIFYNPTGDAKLLSAAYRRMNKAMLTGLILTRDSQWPDPKTLARWSALKQIDCAGVQVPRGFIAGLTQVRQLRILNLTSAQASGVELVGLLKDGALADLRAINCKFGEKNVERAVVIAGLRNARGLKNLEIDGPFTDEEIASLNATNSLSLLFVSARDADAATIEKWRKVLRVPELKVKVNDRSMSLDERNALCRKYKGSLSILRTPSNYFADRGHL